MAIDYGKDIDSSSADSNFDLNQNKSTLNQNVNHELDNVDMNKMNNLLDDNEAESEAETETDSKATSASSASMDVSSESSIVSSTDVQSSSSAVESLVSSSDVTSQEVSDSSSSVDIASSTSSADVQASSAASLRSKTSRAAEEASESTVKTTDGNQQVEQKVTKVAAQADANPGDGNDWGPNWIQPYKNTYGVILEEQNQSKTFDRKLKDIAKRDSETTDSAQHFKNLEELHQAITYHYYGNQPTSDQTKKVADTLQDYSLQDVVKNELNLNQQALKSRTPKYFALNALLTAHKNGDKAVLPERRASADNALLKNRADVKDFDHTLLYLHKFAKPLSAQAKLQQMNVTSNASQPTKSSAVDKESYASSVMDSIYDDTADKIHGGHHSQANRDPYKDDPNSAVFDSIVDEDAKKNRGGFSMKSIWKTLKAAGQAVGDEYKHQKELYRDKAYAAKYDAKIDDYSDKMLQSTPYTKAHEKIWQRFENNIMYERSLRNYEKQYQNADSDKAKDDVKQQLALEISSHQLGRTPNEKEYGATYAKLNSDNSVQDVINHELATSAKISDNDVLRLSTLDGFISKGNQVSSFDKNLADDAMDDSKLYLPNQNQFKSLASHYYDYPAESQAVDKCYEASKQDVVDSLHAMQASYSDVTSSAVDSTATSSASAPASVQASQNSTQVSEALGSDSANESSATWKKASKAAHEFNYTQAAASNIVPLTNTAAGLSKSTLREESILEPEDTKHPKHGKNAAGKSTMNKDIETQGANAEKVVDNTVNETAAQTAADTHDNVNQTLAQQVAELQKQVKNKKQQKALEQQKQQLETELNSLNKKKGFIGEVIDAWNTGRGKDTKADKKHVFITGAIRGGVGAIRLTGKLAMSAALVATGVVSGAVHLLSKASKHASKSFDKSVARGFAPGDGKAMER